MWLHSGDNYNQFIKIYEQSRDRVQAASPTWTGKLATSLGYTPHFAALDDKEDVIDVCFRLARKRTQ